MKLMATLSYDELGEAVCLWLTARGLKGLPRTLVVNVAYSSSNTPSVSNATISCDPPTTEGPLKNGPYR